MIDLLPGTLANFELAGSRGPRWLEATVVGVDPSGVRLRSAQTGRVARVPWTAVIRVVTTTRESSPPAVARAFQPSGHIIEKLDALTAELESTNEEDPAGYESRSLVVALEKIREELERFAENTEAREPIGDRSRRTAKELIGLIDLAVERVQCSNFEQSLPIRDAYESSRRQTKKSVDRPNSRTQRTLRDLFRVISVREADEWRRFSAQFEAHPRIVSPKRVSLNLSAAGEFELPVKVALDDSRQDARSVRVVLSQHRGVELVGNAPRLDRLAPDSTAILKVRLMDRRRQGASDDVRVTARLEYLGPNGERLYSTQHRLNIRLIKPTLFVPIRSPFRQFASGVPVDNPEMFFGREALIADILEHLLDNPPGRCYGLYGQKRTGKSSVMRQVEGRVKGSGALVASLSMAVVDRTSITETFVAEVLDQLREQVAERLNKRQFESLLTRWPDSAAINQQPLASFRRACTAARALTRAPGEDDAKIIVIVDEFTYLFELLRRDNVAHHDQQELREFMRQWKSLLEAKLFSSLVVGQDTMPYFLRAFPNEFSVMHTERLDYLTDVETENLADLPIRRSDGATRFSGYSLPSIHAWTSGHPYFTQILCDRLVSVMNEAKLIEISDLEVDSAVESLLTGPREIGYHRFDCLLSADNTGIIVSDNSVLSDSFGNETPDVSFKVLHRLASLAGPQSRPVDRDRLQLSIAEERVLTDLLLRQVVNEKGGQLQVRVLLFAEYLRRLRP